MVGRFVIYVGLGAALCGLLISEGTAWSAEAACVPTIQVEAMSAGLARIAVSAPCLPGRKVRLHYDAVEVVHSLDQDGKMAAMFDCFLGDKVPLTVSFQDGPTMPVQLQTLDLDRVTKFAVTWKGNVNLDLHAFEYAAGLSDENHVWPGAPSSRWLAEDRKRRDNRGHGFISYTGDGKSEGDQLEVYTFVHEPHQPAGAITLALDYESRARHPRDPDTCGTGLYADLEYKVFVWRPDGRVSRSRGVFSAVECDQPTDELARYSAKALPQLLLMR